MNRLQKVLANARENGEKLLSIFITAGYPQLHSTPGLVHTLEKAGADFVEIGIPFSDPLADGPTIQMSSQVALQNGMNVKTVLEQVRTIRQDSQIPIILMSYLNPVLKFGLDKFTTSAREAGVDGLILPDLTPEEYRNLLPRNGPGVDFLISPVTTVERAQFIDRMTSDFLYCVAVTGVTGARRGVPKELTAYLERIQAKVAHPVMVGFGVSNARDAREISKFCQGIIIGSALIERINAHEKSGNGFETVGEFVFQIKQALEGV